jgi:hypothetical protein
MYFEKKKSYVSMHFKPFSCYTLPVSGLVLIIETKSCWKKKSLKPLTFYAFAYGNYINTMDSHAV